jgi:hypothetical protein
MALKYLTTLVLIKKLLHIQRRTLEDWVFSRLLVYIKRNTEFKPIGRRQNLVSGSMIDHSFSALSIWSFGVHDEQCLEF